MIPPKNTPPPLTADSSLQAALDHFSQHMKDEGFAVNTVKAFTSDIRLLGSYLGIGQSIGEIGTNNLTAYLHWLTHERPVPCSGKSYSRRVTSLKVFFGWLQSSDVLLIDPSKAVIQNSVGSPAPTLPTADDIDRALAITAALRQPTSGKPDVRPHLLLTLLLATGIKKSEAVAIVPNHIDNDDPANPTLFIRYKNPRLRNKERKLPLTPEWVDLVAEYTAQYHPTSTLFTCTARNLEYVLQDVAIAANIRKGLLAFENLRWVYALQAYQNGMEQDTIRQHLGLSKITWRTMVKKLGQLDSRERP